MSLKGTNVMILNGFIWLWMLSSDRSF